MTTVWGVWGVWGVGIGCLGCLWVSEAYFVSVGGPKQDRNLGRERKGFVVLGSSPLKPCLGGSAHVGSYRSAGPLGKTRSPNNEVHRDGPQRFYYHQLRDRFAPVLPSGFGARGNPGTCCNSWDAAQRRDEFLPTLPLGKSR